MDVLRLDARTDFRWKNRRREDVAGARG